jgi:N-acetylglucosaminyl-diphospho-decaprenol L-rhamnosyltransferase
MLPARAERDAQSSVVLSIIIVSWNTREALKECLKSIYACDGDASEVIVVDNASQDDSITMVEREFPEVTLIRNASNAGFARASNQGILSSQGDYVLLLNSDVQVRERALAHMIQFVEEHPQAGAVGPRLVLPDGRPQPYSFGCDPTIGYLLRRGLNLLRGKGYLHDWATADIGEVDWVSGASLMLRRQALEDTGLLDENFFLYFEDNDLCLRLRQRGWKVYFCPAVNVVHLGGQSLMKNEAARDEYYHSLAYFYRKHYGNLTIALALLLPVYRLLLEFRGRGGGHPPEVGC